MTPESRCLERWRSSSTWRTAKVSRHCWAMCLITRRPYVKWRNMASRSRRTSQDGYCFGDQGSRRSRSSSSNRGVEIWKSMRWSRRSTICWGRTTRPGWLHQRREMADTDPDGIERSTMATPWTMRSTRLMMIGRPWTMRKTHTTRTKSTMRWPRTRCSTSTTTRRVPIMRLTSWRARQMVTPNWRRPTLRTWMLEGSLPTWKLPEDTTQWWHWHQLVVVTKHPWAQRPKVLATLKGEERALARDGQKEKGKDERAPVSHRRVAPKAELHPSLTRSVWDVVPQTTWLPPARGALAAVAATIHLRHPQRDKRVMDLVWWSRMRP